MNRKRKILNRAFCLLLSVIIVIGMIPQEQMLVFAQPGGAYGVEAESESIYAQEMSMGEVYDSETVNGDERTVAETESETEERVA